MNSIFTQNLIKYFLPLRGTGSGNVSTTGHSFNKAGGVNMFIATRNATKLITHFFSPINALTSKPNFTFTTNLVIVQVFYYIPMVSTGNNTKTINNNTVNNLGETLSTIFEQPVELRLVKLNYPYLDSYILAQYIALNTQDYTFLQIVRRIFGSIGVSPIIPTQPVKSGSDDKKYYILSSAIPLGAIIGIKVRVSGRLMTERSRPRQTMQTAQIGSFSSPHGGQENLFLVDSASFTTKNKKGAFTIKVWISQRAIV